MWLFQSSFIASIVNSFKLFKSTPKSLQMTCDSLRNFSESKESFKTYDTGFFVPITCKYENGTHRMVQSDIFWVFIKIQKWNEFQKPKNILTFDMIALQIRNGFRNS